jgi:predicted aldo/keto reductase-like oxidoreductase
MQYRRFGKLDWKVSALGFGCMRLPQKPESSEIDEEIATKMLRYAIDHGLNYVDTAYGYHGGNSERFLGRALQNGYRQKVRLATKMPQWLVQEAADFDRLFDEQLSKLQTDHLDVYLIHSLDKNAWHKMRDLGIIKWAEGRMAEGQIGELGFSFHDNLDAFREIIDAYPGWAFCQIQYNYIDIENQAGTKGLQYAASKGLGVVVMEPLLGGRLVNPPEPVQTLWDSAPKQQSAVAWALQWLWNQPEVSVVLSGMSTMEQVVENIALAEQSGNVHLTQDELALIAQVRGKYEELCPIPCTQCKYCMPCPNGVNIPRNFAIYNGGVMYNQIAGARRGYIRQPEAERASACIQCRECESKCPQHIEISERMPEVHGVLGEGKPYAYCATK